MQTALIIIAIATMLNYFENRSARINYIRI